MHAVLHLSHLLAISNGHKLNFRACLHGGLEPQVGEATRS